MSADLETAVAFAASAHRGQRYGDGPYILHPLRVMMAVRSRCRVAAVLHDCEEDAGRLPPDLDGADEEAVWLLTRPRGMSYVQYVDRLAEAEGEAGEIAREVKAADLLDNMSHMRLGKLDLLARYRQALRRLERVAEGSWERCTFCGGECGPGKVCARCLEKCVCRFYPAAAATACPVHGLPPHRMEHFKGMH